MPLSHCQKLSQETSSTLRRIGHLRSWLYLKRYSYFSQTTQNSYYNFIACISAISELVDQRPKSLSFAFSRPWHSPICWIASRSASWSPIDRLRSIASTHLLRPHQRLLLPSLLALNELSIFQRFQLHS
jgi:hypothetical protein